MRWKLAWCLMAAALAVAPDALHAQQSSAEMRERFEQEPNVVRKAKMMSKLGAAQFDEFRQELAGDKFPDALTTLRQYRDEVAESSQALDALHVNAERHPGGFRELQISLREFLRGLNETLPTLTGDKQEPILKIRKDLEDTNQHLIHELFPTRPPADSNGA